MPPAAMKKEEFPFYRKNMWDYDFQTAFSSWNHEKKKAGKTCVLVGIRTQESLHRWRTIAGGANITRHNGRPWTVQITENVFNAYPIYDWVTEDIWTANAKFGFAYNELYDLFYYAGVPIDKQRVASPFLSAAQESLKLYRAVDPDVWGRMVSRVNGVNFTAIYGGTAAMGWRKITKPEHFTWKQYMEFLLSTLPKETADNYRRKLETSIKFWRNRGGVLSEQAVADLKAAGVTFEVSDSTNYKTDKKPVRMDYIDDIDSTEFTLIPSYKRMCVCILKNDHLCKYMGFTQTQEEAKRRAEAIEKYKNL